MIEYQHAYPKAEEVSELERHLDTGATPLAGAEYPDVQKIQAQVKKELLRRIIRSAPHDTPLPVRSFMVHSFLMRFANRDSKNYDSYTERLFQTAPADTDLDFSNCHERALRGTASPEELIIVRRTLGMKAIELARLTHPYGVMIDRLNGMREETATAITGQGGVLFDPEDYNEKYKLRSTGLLIDPERREQVMSLLITRRRDIGMVDDDTLVMERSSFIVPVYEGSEYDPVLSKQMRSVRMIDNPHRIQELEEAGRIKDVVPELLGSDNFKAAIPQSTTIFGYNQSTDLQVVANRERISNERKLYIAEKYPEIAKARLEYMRQNGHTPLSDN